MKLTVAIEEFMIAQEADGSSPSTLNWYRSLLKKFKVLIGDVEIDHIDTPQIRKYIIAIRHDYKPDTAHAHIRAQHKFWRWCAIEYDITSPMRNIKYPGQPKQELPKAADIDDLRSLFQAIDITTPIGIRNRAICAFLADTGARAAGVCSLKTANLDLEKRQAVVVEKGQKKRIVVFTDLTQQYLEDWMAVRSHVEPVFYNLRTLRPLTPSGLGQLMKRLKADAGINGRVNPHALRHAFAREYLKAGGDLATLSRLMGHTDVSTTTSYYAIFTQSELADQHDMYSQINHILDSREN